MFVEKNFNTYKYIIIFFIVFEKIEKIKSLRMDVFIYLFIILNYRLHK